MAIGCVFRGNCGIGIHIGYMAACDDDVLADTGLLRAALVLRLMGRKFMIFKRAVRIKQNLFEISCRLFVEPASEEYIF